MKRFLLSLSLIVAIATLSFSMSDTDVASSSNSTYAYSLILRTLTPQINRGGTVEIEAFLSGYGIPEKNKLAIIWSSPYMIDRDNPGTFKNGDMPSVGIDPNGIMAFIYPPMFRARSEPDTNYAFPQIMTEMSLTTQHAPLILKVNTSKKAPFGDYDIAFIFTYGDGQNIYQDYKVTTFHINSWWETFEPHFVLLAIFIALISLAISIWKRSNLVAILDTKRKGLKKK